MLWSRRAWLPLVILIATVAQLAVATFVPIDRFEGKAFGVRLLLYPLMTIAVPAGWWVRHRADQRRADQRRAAPWGAFALVMAPFLIDVTGNSLDLYDSIAWWDDANHFVNWLLLLAGLGLIAAPRGLGLVHTVVYVGGLGAALAIGWEVGEWYTFIRHGTELETAYTDTLGDEALGTLGAILAGVLVARARRGEMA